MIWTLTSRVTVFDWSYKKKDSQGTLGGVDGINCCKHIGGGGREGEGEGEGESAHYIWELKAGGSFTLPRDIEMAHGDVM